ncbi:MAG: O-antigen ligase family protein [Verrucomicrobia bacterium]|nr:O-antigen ligase family protein [Verrucomicrobiota bacterium]
MVLTDSETQPSATTPRPGPPGAVLQNFWVEGPRWALLGVVLAAPWVYGATRPWARLWLTEVLLGLTLWFVAGRVVVRRLPRIHRAAALFTLLLLLQGWGMAWNARQRFRPEVFAFTTVPSPVPWLPGVVDAGIVQERLALVTGLVGAFWVAGDLAFHARWRKRFWTVLALNGAGIAALGLAQRITGAEGIYWGSPVDTGATSFFATYRYHANAGAFLNLTLPFLILKAVQVFGRLSGAGHRHYGIRSGEPCVIESRWRRLANLLERVFLPAAALVTAAAGFVNVSKAAMAIEILLLGAVLIFWSLGRAGKGLGRRELALGTLLAALAGGVIWAFGFEVSLHRWQEFLADFSSNPRYLVDEIIVRRVLSISGWWGFGAGTFRIIFPFFTRPWGDRVGGVWEYAHEDYLQTLVEWGFIGAALWAALFLGGWVTAVARRTQSRVAWPESTRLFSLGCLLSLTGVGLHALVDFPLQIASLALYTAVVLAFLYHLPAEPLVRRKKASAGKNEMIRRTRRRTQKRNKTSTDYPD